MAPPPPLRFKVGDAVRVVRKAPAVEGKTGSIVEVHPEDWLPYWVHLPDLDDALAFRDSELDPVQDQQRCLTCSERYRALLRVLMDRIGNSSGVVLSPLVEAEVLVLPLKERGEEGASHAEELFESLPHVRWVGMGRSTARLAAQLRASEGHRIADVLILAAAREGGAEVVLGNDLEIARRSKTIPYLALSDFLAPASSSS